MTRILGHTVTALALLWYLILKKKSLSLFPGELRPNPKDAFSFLWAFPGLILIAVSISLMSTRISSFSMPPRVLAPVNAPGWIIMALSCIGTGYLEETYFRFYLMKKLEEWAPPRLLRITISVLLFTLCHVYGGIWGILNAALAGLLLSVLFERYRSLHGLAMAHALYNALVYTMGIFYTR